MQPVDRFLAACNGQPVDRTPVWFMRQAGRYQPEYRAIREKHSLLEIISSAELSAKVALLPVAQLGVDAAIIFADILPPLIPMGMDLEYARGEGPVLHNPLRTRQDIEVLQSFDVLTELDSTLEALRIVRNELDGKTALIGFAGGPFTLASYAIEGGSSRNYRYTKSLMYTDEPAWQLLMQKIADMTISYLTAQIEAGAQCVQLFDSWAGALSPADYQRYVLPATRRILQEVAGKGAPTILFGTTTSGLLELIASAGSTVVGVDWRINLDAAWQTIGWERPIQGNLDPIVLFASEDVIREQVTAILEQAEGRPGHIFNLGHGIIPETPVEAVKLVVEIVHGFDE